MSRQSNTNTSNTSPRTSVRGLNLEERINLERQKAQNKINNNNFLLRNRREQSIAKTRERIEKIRREENSKLLKLEQTHRSKQHQISAKLNDKIDHLTEMFAERQRKLEQRIQDRQHRDEQRLLLRAQRENQNMNRRGAVQRRTTQTEILSENDRVTNDVVQTVRPQRQTNSRRINQRNRQRNNIQNVAVDVSPVSDVENRPNIEAQNLAPRPRRNAPRASTLRTMNNMTFQERMENEDLPNLIRQIQILEHGEIPQIPLEYVQRGNFQGTLYDDGSCPVCLDNFGERDVIVRFPCNHTTCPLCAPRCEHCPVCRYPN